MFGYIKTVQPELKVKELELYKAVYCGLCRVLAKEYSVAARFTLSYDFTFLAMLHAGVSEQTPKLELCSCPFNPLKKRPHIIEDDSMLFATDISMMMLWAKNQDDVSDSGFFKSALMSGILPFSTHAANKATVRNPEAKEIISRLTAQQQQAEDSEDVSFDLACAPSAEALSKIFGLMSQVDTEKRVLERLGYMIGRFCYICDAIDDLDKDIKNNSFNMLKQDFATERLEGLANATIFEACKAYELLEINQYKEILDNIIYLGLQQTADDLINRRTKNERPI